MASSTAHVQAGLGADCDRVGGVDADDVLDLLLDRSGSADGRSILFSTGTTSRPCSTAV
jgi:hypothetical protein